MSAERGPRAMAPRLLLAAALAAGCGGQTDGTQGGSAGVGGDGGPVDAGGSGGTAGAGGAAGDGGAAGQGGAGGLGWTDCTTPDVAFCGYAECQSCPGDAYCPDIDTEDVAPMDVCFGAGDFDYRVDLYTHAPRDGRVGYAYAFQAETGRAMFTAVPFSGAQLLAERGFASYLAYADRGKWTGAPLPAPSECPEVAGLDLCGAHCGGCPAGQICTGRSPLHAWGFCVPEEVSDDGFCSVDPVYRCTTGGRCFVYTVEPEQQYVADSNGMCLPRELCEAAAAGLPGGGRCE